MLFKNKCSPFLFHVAFVYLARLICTSKYKSCVKIFSRAAFAGAGGGGGGGKKKKNLAAPGPPPRGPGKWVTYGCY
jgi:hypothetical protein